MSPVKFIGAIFDTYNRGTTGVTPPSNNGTSQVLGMNIFWVLLTLCTASSLHPLGRVTGLREHKYNRYLRLLPLTALVDTVSFLIQCFFVPLAESREVVERTNASGLEDDSAPTTERGFFFGIRRLHLQIQGHTAARLVESIRAVSSQQDRGSRIWHAVIPHIVDFRARLFIDALIILQYAKLMSYSGLRWILVFATIYFAVWAGLEFILLISYGWSGRATQVLDEKDQRTIPHDTSVRSTTHIPVWVCSILLMLQIIGALTVVCVWIYLHTSSRYSNMKLVGKVLFWPCYLFDTCKISVTISLEFIAHFGFCYFYLLLILWGIAVVVPWLVFSYLVALFQILWLAFLLIAPFVVLLLPLRGHTVLFRLWGLLVLRIVLLLACVASIVYFAKFFDGSGTSKPAWTEHLL